MELAKTSLGADSLGVGVASYMLGYTCWQNGQMEEAALWMQRGTARMKADWGWGPDTLCECNAAVCKVPAPARPDGIRLRRRARGTANDGCGRRPQLQRPISPSKNSPRLIRLFLRQLQQTLTYRGKRGFVAPILLWLVLFLCLLISVLKYLMGLILKLSFPATGIRKDYTWQPTVSVLLPCYNEGATVYQTIESISRSNYPNHLFEIIAQGRLLRRRQLRVDAQSATRLHQRPHPLRTQRCQQRQGPHSLQRSAAL